MCTVVPYIGTWIETTNVPPNSITNVVVPYIGTWIETSIFSWQTALVVGSYLI